MLAFSFFSMLKRLYTIIYPPTASAVETDRERIKFGILGAAAIAPPALINPAKSHAEVTIYAVAARDKERAAAYAKSYGIEKVYGGPTGYQDLLNDPEVDAVYNPLPNGLHYEWTMKALLAGKHVLLEKPAADTAEETRAMFDLAEKKGLVLLEAFHYRFHPAIQRAKAILTSGELGAVKSISTEMTLPRGPIKDSNIRYDLKLGGGAMMDMGCYTLHSMRYIASANPITVLSSTAIPHRPSSTVDRRTTATLSFPRDIVGTLTCDFGVPPSWGILPKFPRLTLKVECEGGSLELFNFVMPTIYHSITVRKGKKTDRVEKAYTFADPQVKGEDWWTTYRYQLEAFVDRLKGRTPQTWLEKEESVANMEWIERIYETNGLGVRPKSEYVPSE